MPQQPVIGLCGTRTHSSKRPPAQTPHTTPQTNAGSTYARPRQLAKASGAWGTSTRARRSPSAPCAAALLRSPLLHRTAPSAHASTPPLSSRNRDFLLGNYAEMKKGNPETPILVRECANAEARLIARYGESWVGGVRLGGRWCSGWTGCGWAGGGWDAVGRWRGSWCCSSQTL